MVVRPIGALALARLRRRSASTGLAVAAMASASALIVLIAGIALVAADATLARALAGTGADRPVVRASTFSPSSRDAAAVQASAAVALGQLDGLAEPPIRGLIVRELVDLDAPVFELIVAVDDPGPLTTLLEGRLPAPCRDGLACEAVLLAEDPGAVPLAVAHPAADLHLTIVGRGVIDRALPFGDLDQRGPFGSEPGGGQYQTGRASPAVLLVRGVDAVASSPALEGTGRTYVWTAAVLADAVHPWTADRFRAAIDATTRSLAADDAGFGVTSPVDAVDAALARADVAQVRSILVGGLGVATLIAFTVFLALVTREDLAAELTRLRAIGARRQDRWLLILLEAGLPVIVGGVVGWVLGVFAIAVIAAGTGSDVAPVVRGAVLSPGVVLGSVGILGLCALATVAAVAPGPAGPTLPRTVAAVGVTVAGLLTWQALTGGQGAADASSRGPVVVLLPAALAFVVAMSVTVGARPLVRVAARRSGGASLAVRLALVSIARESARPAATVTLLAFSLGGMVFASGWGAGLDRGIQDGAAYRAGLDLRVSELGTGTSISGSVVPIARYDRLGQDVAAVPVYRATAIPDAEGRTEILAVPPSALASLAGWRPDFADEDIVTLASRLEMPAPTGGWTARGHRLAADAPTLMLRFRYDGRPLRLDAIVTTTDGDSATVHLGDLDASMREVAVPLPAGARGGLVTALIFRNPGLVQGSGHQDELRRATVTFSGLEGLVDDRPIDIEVFTTAAHIIRAPVATDGLRIPAVVSPDLAATAGESGELDLQISGDGVIPLRVVGVARLMPTIMDEQPRFVVAPLEPFLVALSAAVPGAGRPTEMWLDVPDDPTRAAEVRAALDAAPFRFARVVDREAIIAASRDDPLTVAIVWTLIAAAMAGLVLAVGALIVGAVADLRDPRGEAADLEAQGVRPSALRRVATMRSSILVVAGAVMGSVVGVLLTGVVTDRLSLAADGLAPVPPLAMTVPVPMLVGLMAGVVLLVVGVTSWLARRTFGSATLGERRDATRTRHAVEASGTDG